MSQVIWNFALLGDRQTQLSFIDGILGYRNRAVYAFTIEGTIPPLFCFSIRLHGAHLAQGIRGGSLWLRHLTITRMNRES